MSPVRRLKLNPPHAQRDQRDVAAFRPKIIVYLLFLAAWSAVAFGPVALAKDPPLTAIMLFDAQRAELYPDYRCHIEREGGAAWFVTLRPESTREATISCPERSSELEFLWNEDLMAC